LWLDAPPGAGDACVFGEVVADRDDDRTPDMGVHDKDRVDCAPGVSGGTALAPLAPLGILGSAWAAWVIV
jgi:hypothetical protein